MNKPTLPLLFVNHDLNAGLQLRATLQAYGFKVMLANDVAQARSCLDASPGALVIIDADLPERQGFEICTRLRRCLGQELPILMLSSTDEDAAIERAFAAGATDFCSQPVNWALLHQRLLQLMRSYESIQRLHRAQAVAHVGSWYLDLRRNTLEWSPETYRMFGLPEGTPLSYEGFLALVHPDDVAPLDLAWKQALQGAPYHFEHRIVVDGKIRWVLEQAELSFDDAGELRAGVGTVLDITERKTASMEAHRLTYFDILTGLPNRPALVKQLERDIQQAGLQNSKLALLFLNLDGFKTINETLGHDSGDLLLCGVARRLRQALRPFDQIEPVGFPDGPVHGLARLGGDEFALLLGGLRDGADALAVAQRILAALQPAFSLQGREIIATASMGIAIYPDDATQAEQLFQCADTAMHHAKSQGGNNAQFYKAELTQSALRRLDMKNSLRQALERDEFFLVYQPQFDPSRSRICAAEALIRWRHPQRGLVSPGEFIPLAEESGLIVPIGAWVLRAACAQAKVWQDAGLPLRVAVNFSAVQFRHPQLVEHIASVLHETGLAAEYLELEVTEGALLEDSEATLQTFKTLRAMGLRLSLDDFGTGYSSLSYLKRLPLNNLKVDQSFVSGLPSDSDSLAIVSAILGLAKNLGFTVTAEGVETHEQALLLQGMACDKLQGYYFSRPVPGSEIAGLLARDWTTAL